MEQEGLYVEYGDTFKVTKDPDGYKAIRVNNSAWVEEPRWLHFGNIDGDKRRLIEDLIYALEQLRASQD
ncbi:hypothetical protein ACT3TP_15970 [Glutamicibacter sp. AOP38-B1-38]|uniref:hypothetical protein n=1 Tax=Glutamicibacter sp. AOP38-B1-38 TaxID=3457680 RepID=UPI004033B86B